VAAIKSRKKAVDRTTNIGRSSRWVKIKINTKRKMIAKLLWMMTTPKLRRATKISNHKSRSKVKTKMRHMMSRVIIP